MWALRCNQGRQWWEFDAEVFSTGAAESGEVGAGLEAVLKEVDGVRAQYALHRLNHRHCSDSIRRVYAKSSLASSRLWDANLENRAEADSNSNPVPEDCARDAESTAAFKGMRFFAGLQMADGHWPGDYGGPLFLLPGMVIACRVSKVELDDATKHEMVRYIRNTQNQDGGWGLHIESDSAMFCTALSYVALRLLGMTSTAEEAVRARRWIHEHGTALSIPSWGKFWLAALGVYDWRGMNPLTPEMWLLPYWLPVHPGRYWCHCRMVYLPMSFLYGLRATGDADAVVQELRTELYTQPYESIKWADHRYHCCPADEYFVRSPLQKLFWGVLYMYEWSPVFAPLRRLLRPLGLRETMLQVDAEDHNTNYIDIGPVNKVLNTLCTWYRSQVLREDPAKIGEASAKKNSAQPLQDADASFARHVEPLKDYLWLSEDGMKMQGYNGSQLWDSAFAVQAYATWPDFAAESFPKTMRSAHAFLDVAQVREDVPRMERVYRHISKGAWPFSTRNHGWPIADCSSEGLKATLALQVDLAEKFKLDRDPISLERLEQCVNVILSFQNRCGGWATYELTRSYDWLEYLNPSEVFGNIMIDYPYVELSSACITALTAFLRSFPGHQRTEEMRAAVAAGIRWVKSNQRADGSWYGSWAVCFTYGTWFGVEALVAAGETLANSGELQTACSFLISKQKEDGSWGETYLSSRDKVYSQAEEGQVVNTSWALLALCKAQWRDPDAAADSDVDVLLRPLQRAADFLVSMQMDDGDWPQQLISGVFNHNCMITYINYRNIFPIWALGEFHQYRQALRTCANARAVSEAPAEAST